MEIIIPERSYEVHDINKYLKRVFLILVLIMLRERKHISKIKTKKASIH